MRLSRAVNNHLSGSEIPQIAIREVREQSESTQSIEIRVIQSEPEILRLIKMWSREVFSVHTSRLELKSLTSDERKYEDQNRIQLRIHLHLSLRFTPKDCSWNEIGVYLQYTNIDASSLNKTIFYLLSLFLFNLVGCIRSEVLYYVVALVVVPAPEDLRCFCQYSRNFTTLIIGRELIKVDRLIS